MALTPNQQAVELIGRAKNILVTTSERADTDAIASVLAFGLVLNKLNKQFDLVVPGIEAKDIPAFLPKGPELRPTPGGMRAFRIRLNVKDVPLSELLYDVKDGTLEITVVPKANAWKPNDVSFSHGDDRYDLVIALGAPDMSGLGAMFREQADFLYRTTVLNIDCHAANEYWGQVNLVDLNAVSVSEMLHGFLQAWNPSHVDADVATCVLAGMISRTHGFRSATVTPKTLKTASELVERGARRADIVQGLWRTQSVATLKLWGRALTHLEQDRELGFVWSTLTERDFVESGASRDALDGVVEELIGAAPEAKIVALLSPARAGIHVSLHAHAPLDASEIARAFNGTGTRERASFSWDGPGDLADDARKIVEKIKSTLSSASSSPRP